MNGDIGYSTPLVYSTLPSDADGARRSIVEGRKGKREGGRRREITTGRHACIETEEDRLDDDDDGSTEIEE